MHDMYRAIEHVAQPRKEINPQPIYNARTLAAQRGGPTWVEQRGLSVPQPVQFDRGKTSRIFQVLDAMIRQPASKDGSTLVGERIDSQIITVAETVLFTGGIDLSPSMKLSEYEQGSDTRPPYVIRGHHLHYFEDVGYVSPESRARRITEGMTQTQSKIQSNPTEYHPIAAQYYADTVGQTPQSHKLYRKKLEANFQEFADLPEDYPVELRPAAKDALCNACDVGDHCGKARFPLRTSSAAEYDTSHISAFVHEAIRLGSRDDLQLITGTTKLTTREHTVEGIRTSAGTFKAVLQGSPMEWVGLTEQINFRKRW